MPQDTAALLETLVKVIEVVLIPILWKVYNAISDLILKVHNLTTILIGPDGKNGIRSRVRRLEMRQEQMALLLASHFGGDAASKLDDEGTDE